MKTRHKGQPKDCREKLRSPACLRTRNNPRRKGKRKREKNICERCRAVQD